MNVQNITAWLTFNAPWLTLVGVLISLIFTLRNTRKINAINRETTLLLAEYTAKGQLRMAAIDRRLQAHQEAFTLWRELCNFNPQKSVIETVLECQTWWDNNCLYLEPEVRQAFVESYMSAKDHDVLFKTQGDERWQKFAKFPDVLFKAIKLPALSEIEIKSIKPDSNKQ